MNDISKKAIRRRMMSFIGDGCIVSTIEKCGVCHQSLYAKKDTTISVMTLCKLCDGLGCTPNDLLGYGEE